MRNLLQAFLKALKSAQKARLQNSYIWGTSPDDRFCLETWSRYYYNKKRGKFKALFIRRSSRKKNRNNLLIAKKFASIILFMEKDFQVFQCTKKVFHAFSFQLCSAANSKCIKIQTMSLVLNLFQQRFFVFYLLWGHHSPATEKKVPASWTFFSVARMK